MLSNFSQFAPQGQIPQIPGLQGIGSPQLNPALSGQPGPHGNGWLGQELGPQGGGHQVPPWGAPNNPFAPQLHNAVHIVPVLGQLAQQLTIQSALAYQVAQQIGAAVQHLAQQLAVQGPQGQYFGQNPFAAAMQGGYSGGNPYAQGWGAGRPPPTVQ
jgi:hypothetical protein